MLVLMLDGDDDGLREAGIVSGVSGMDHTMERLASPELHLMIMINVIIMTNLILIMIFSSHPHEALATCCAHAWGEIRGLSFDTVNLNEHQYHYHGDCEEEDEGVDQDAVSNDPLTLTLIYRL